MKLLSLCVSGTDGTGKSTLINAIKDWFPTETVCLQYMGLKEWETNIAKICFENDSSSLIIKLRSLVVIYELRHRVYKHRNKKDTIVLFDRYTYEQYARLDEKTNKTWKEKCICLLYKVFFVQFMYKPTLTIYLTCDEKESIKRKMDIVTPEDKERLKVNKQALDNFFCNRSQTIVVNTTSLNAIEVQNFVYGIMKERECFSTLMK